MKKIIGYLVLLLVFGMLFAYMTINSDAYTAMFVSAFGIAIWGLVRLAVHLINS